MIILGVTCWVIFSMGITQVCPAGSSSRYTAMSCCAGLITIVAVNLIAGWRGAAYLPTLSDVRMVSFRNQLPDSCSRRTGGFMLGQRCCPGRCAINALLFMNMIPVSAFIIAFMQGKVIDPMELYGMLLVVSALLANNLLPRIRPARSATALLFRIAG